MRVGITGASGFIGSHFIRKLNENRHQCVAFSRTPTKPVSGCIETRELHPSKPFLLENIDAMVNLAGENILGLWTSNKCNRIRESRVRLTQRLVHTIHACTNGPKILLNASGIGVYGDRGDEILNESSAPGRGFLTDVVLEWEGAAGLGTSPTSKAVAEINASAGLRVAAIRFGLVLGPGAKIGKLLDPVFRQGLGARIGNGKQWMSLIHVEDVASALLFLLTTSSAAGVFNGTCPAPVQNREFTKALAKSFNTSASLVIPAIALRIILGDMSHLLLDSERAIPQRLESAGFPFKYPDVQSMIDSGAFR